MGQVHGLNQRRTHELDPSLRAELFEVTTKEGRSFVGIRLEQRLPDGREPEFRTDLERLEFIEKKAAAYAESGDRSERYEQVGDTQVRLKRGNVLDRGEEVTVQLLQKERYGSEEWQAFTTQADKLKAAVHEGQNLEKELNLTERWHVLVEANWLTRDESGRIHAPVFASFASEEKAHVSLGKNNGLALYMEPQRREFGKNDTIELWANADLLLSAEHHAVTVEQQLGQVEAMRAKLGLREGRDHAADQGLAEQSIGPESAQYRRGRSI